MNNYKQNKGNKDERKSIHGKLRLYNYLIQESKDRYENIVEYIYNNRKCIPKDNRIGGKTSYDDLYAYIRKMGMFQQDSENIIKDITNIMLFINNIISKNKKYENDNNPSNIKNRNLYTSLSDKLLYIKCLFN